MSEPRVFNPVYLQKGKWYFVSFPAQLLAIKSHPFKVLLSGDEVSGAALADQVKNLDWRSRQAQYKGKINTIEMQQIKAKIAALLKLA